MEDGKTTFALLLHNHQPVGNMPEVLEEVFSKAYLPFIEVIKKNPEFKVTLHYSGVLFEWLKEAHPEFLETVKGLLQREQIELATGGFYEPILPVIPEEDQIGQIHKLNAFIEDNFKYHPRGMWVAERVWEPHLPKVICQAGVQYVVLDDSHFAAAGAEKEHLFGYFVTEEAGFPLNIFPSSMRLRYLVPFSSPEEVIKYLKIQNKQGADLVVVGDDGEKFGAWPETYQHVYEKRWLEKFLHLVAENSSWLTTATLSECLHKNKPSGRIYLPTASYSEMAEWSGGHWRNYFVKYPESNNLHKKMLYVSSKVHKSKRTEALNELWRGQCNDGYWHGIFGGLYLPHLRSALYSHLIKAETMADEEILGNEFWQEVEEFDFDRDGCKEIIVSASKWNLYFDYQNGGGLFELDYRPKAINLLNTLTRRKEAYHQEILQTNSTQRKRKVKSIHELSKVKERGLEKYLVYDRYRRVSFIDHFLSIDLKLPDFKEVRYQELGDFASGDYSVKIAGKEPVELHFERYGKVLGENVLLNKNFIIDNRESKMDVNYKITNLGNQALNLFFGIEFNLLFPAKIKGSLDKITWDDKLNVISDVDAGELKIWDLENLISVTMSFDKRAMFWVFPVETVSQSEEGFERIYQGTAILPYWRLELMPEESWHLKMEKALKEETE